ncbi:methyl-accepting chemotaxis protein [Spirilliplanes yamanashiensis]|uniref:Methyl-accepting chemotaxis protein n=1 Tax=Spirilliplanes yamanashiensis TaxID=42233 RepID=A0A8J3YDN4_9ACTN|nr:methyl-accepting chemotaxis protein [Spirilliplanes yamanashiensis]MDP9816288.1 methyl-accepting chemotaxis protein [Spirilliplanes yamanashiensis]GIJ05815.1 methyl-accepting chemotaxis protein [Spirilliplanes yamanashiensis]
MSAPGGHLWRDLPVTAKILSAIAIAGLAAVTIGIVGIVKLGAVDETGGGIYERNLLPVSTLAEIDGNVNEVRATMLRHVLSTDEAQMAQLDRELAGFRDGVATVWRDYTADPGTSDEQAARQDFDTALAAMYTVADNDMLPRSRANDVAGARTAETERFDPAFDRVSAALTRLNELETAQATAAAQNSESTYQGARTTLLVVLVVGLILAVVAGVYVARSISRPLSRLVDVLNRVEQGDLTATADIDSRDEVGRLATTLNSSNRAVAELVRRIGGNADGLSAAAQQLDATSLTIAAAAEQTAAQATAVSSASDQVSHHVQTVAAGSEEMGASIREIAQNASQAAEVANGAVATAAGTTATVAKLGDSSQQIGEVVKVITSIAEQTNLLALNATIEAARAGEAGKGFAVVASEVKELAQETARATQDIYQRVAAIQSDTGLATSAIGEIAAVIERINEYQMTISSAVEQQAATTNEMGRSVAEAASSSSEIASNITGVAQAASETTQGVTQAQQASAELARMSGELQTLVGRFRV